MTRPLRVAILGAGIGAEHLAAYRRLPDRYEVTLICDRDTGRAEKIGGGTVAVTGDIGAALSAPGIDLIDICLPPHLHVPVTVRALEAGRHVICEKPLACSLEDLDALEAAVARTGRMLFPVFQYRYGQAMAELRQLIDQGLTGRPFAATLETHWNRGAGYYAAPWRGTWAGEQGGAVLGHAIHIHDLMTHLMGPVDQVSAEIATRVNAIETEDCAAILFRMVSGALVTSSVTLGGAGDMSRLKLVFEGMTAESGRSPYAPMSGGWRFTARAPAMQADIDRVLGDVAPVRPGFEGFLAATADQISGTGPGTGAVTLAEARRSIEIVTAIYQSARFGVPVALPIGPETPCYRGWRPAGTKGD